MLDGEIEERKALRFGREDTKVVDGARVVIAYVKGCLLKEEASTGY